MLQTMQVEAQPPAVFEALVVDRADAVIDALRACAVAGLYERRLLIEEEPPVTDRRYSTAEEHGQRSEDTSARPVRWDAPGGGHARGRAWP